VWQVFDQKIDWYRLTPEDYVALRPNDNNILCSAAFPGLWLDVNGMLAGDMRQVLDVLNQGFASEAHQQFIKQLNMRCS
jgi:hypothetical protein